MKAKVKSDNVVQLALFNTAKTEIVPYSPININTNEYIPFGSDNLFPQAMALFSRTSPNHRGVINGKRRYTIGHELISSDTETQNFLNSCNLDEENLQDVISKAELDYIIGGNAYFEVITAKNGGFVYFNHIDFTKCRKSKENTHILVNPDWSQYAAYRDQTVKIPLYPKFEPDPNNSGILRSIVHMFDYEPEFYYYGLPCWIAGKDSIQIDLKTNRWNLARLINAFKVSGIMFVPVKDSNESASVIEKLKLEHTGDMNQDKLMVITKSRSAENERAEQVQLIQNKQDETGSWLELHGLSISDIITAHSWYRALSGIADNTGFDTKRILNEYSIALSTYIIPRQKTLKDKIISVYRGVTGKKIEFEFMNKKPVDDSDGMFVWEYRREKGLEFNENDIRQQKIIFNGSLIE